MESIIDNIIPHLQTWWPQIRTIGYFLGGLLVLMSLFQKANPKNKYESAKIVWTFIAGVLLLNFPIFIDTLAQTIFATGSEQSLSYSPPSHPGSSYIKFAVYATMLIGAAGVVRGCLLIRDTKNGAPQVTRGVVHFIGGILAINIVQFIGLLARTAGGDVQTTFSKVFGS